MAGAGRARQPGGMAAHRGPQPPARPARLGRAPHLGAARRRRPTWRAHRSRRTGWSAPTRSPTGGSSCCSCARTRRSTPASARRSCCRRCSASTPPASRPRSRRRRRRWRNGWCGRSAASGMRASRSGCRRAPRCPPGCPPCSRRSTARTRSTGSTRATDTASRSRMRRAGWPCCSRPCSTTNRRRGVWRRCSPSRSRGRPRGWAIHGPDSTTRTPPCGIASSSPRARPCCAARPRWGAPLGRFQLEAAIQSVHCDRARTGEVDRESLVKLYRGLVAVAPTSGARAALAAAER